ncbi:MAG TPA: right-handed parallel beta-helix repeat-containing protein [Thermoguttaceae bacterium]|nr:right-handed parallel beta-helix repeat-containing protein [Thermoguttaceae bacterium]
MKSRTTVAIILVAVCGGSLVPAHAFAAVETAFYVAPDGRDDNPGTIDKPFATPARARDAVRQTVAAGLEGGVTVFLRGGTYFLDGPLVLGPEDSGTLQHAITYAAWGEQTPILSGGRRIGGWTKGQGNLWTARLPEVASGSWHFRELFVDGQRAVRARTPNRGDEEFCWRLTDAQIAPDLQTHTLTLGPGKVRPWSRLDDVEAVVLKNWATLHKRVESVEAATGLVTLKGPHVKYFGGNRPRPGGGCFFENSPEMLDVPGEWYLDRDSGVLTYWPLDGQDMGRAEAIAPVLDYVLQIAGEPDRPVRNVHFRGLAVMHHHLPLPLEGHHGRQAAFRYGGDALPAAIRWSHAEGCSMVDCRIAHTGGNGLDLGEGCRGCLVEGNAVFDVGGNGINVGGPNDERLVPKENRVANNYVHHCGAIYFGACAIWAGFAQKTLIEHNLVCEHPYTGISIGWSWNSSPTVAREYIVRYNHVYNVMKEVCDGGAIYSLGYQPGTVLLANHLHDVHRSKYAVAAPNNGIFFDEGSKGFLIEDNAIYRTAGQPTRHNRNQSDWHTWRNNLLIEGDEIPTDLKRVERAGLEPEWQERLTPG